VQSQELTRERLRRLAGIRVEAGRVLSVYVNLDPSEFATGAARASAMRSAVDEADRLAREEGGELAHDARRSLRGDVKRVSDLLATADLKGAHGLAVFASDPADLLEAVRLPRSVPNKVVVDSSPFVEPLVEMAASAVWYVLLANRRDARFFRGTAEGLVEVGRLTDEVHGQHDQGGWSQARYQRSIENEAMHHLRRSSQELLGQYRRAPFDHLLLGAPEDAYTILVGELHTYLRERLRGRIEIDVETATASEVHQAARAVIERCERERQDELLARLQEAVGAGRRGAARLPDVLRALNEQRVETLLVDERFSAAGVECPRCGWLGVGTEGSVCPADGSSLEARDDVTEKAVERGLMQDAEIAVLRGRPELGAYGGIAAVLRF
jgi:peptide chain release factor subunit 1